MVRRSTVQAASSPAWSAIRWTSLRRRHPLATEDLPPVAARQLSRMVPGADEPDGEDHHERRDEKPAPGETDEAVHVPTMLSPRPRPPAPALLRYPRGHVTDRDLPLLPVRRQPRSSLTRWLDRLPEGRFGLVVTAPGLLLVGAFVLPPILAAVGMSFFRIELLRDEFTPFIGFRNYAVRLAADLGIPRAPCRSPSVSRS